MKKSSYTSISNSKSNLLNIQQTCLDHEGEPLTNFCSAAQCVRGLCPECVEIHLDVHKKLDCEPQLQSFKTVKQKCIRKLKQILEKINTESESYGIKQSIQLSKSYENSLKKLREARQTVDRIVKSYFNKYEDSLKKKISALSQDNQINKILETTQNIVKQVQNLSKNIESSNNFIENIVKTVKLDSEKLIDRVNEDYRKIKELKEKSEIKISIDRSLEQNLVNMLTQSITFGANQENNDLNMFNSKSSNSVRQDPRRSEMIESTKLNRKKSSMQEQKMNRSRRELSESGSQRNTNNNKLTKHKSSLQQSKSINKQIIGLNTFKQESKRKYLHFFQNDDNYLHLLDLNSTFTTFIQIKLDISFRIPYYHKSISTPNGDLYLIGGSIPQSVIKSQKIYKYNFQNKTLDIVANLKFGRSSHALAFNNKFIYIVGGYLNNQVVTDKCERYDILSNQIEEIASCNHPVNSLCLASFNGRYLFKFGGNGPSKEIVHYIERYDQKKNQWEVLNPVFQSFSNEFQLLSTSAAIQITQNEIMVMGGYDENNQGYKQTYIFLIEGETYTIKQINQYPLPYGEGFWNNNPIIQNKIVFALQNLATIDKEDCIQSNRRILTFNGTEWKAIK